MRRMPTAGVRPLWLSVDSRHAPVQAVAPARLDHDGSRQRHQPLQIGQLVDAKNSAPLRVISSSDRSVLVAHL